MRSRLPSFVHVLRASFLALLVLGLMIKPVLAQLSELHGIEHAIAAASEGFDHDHDHEHDSDDTDAGVDPESDLTDTHSLMHQCSGATSMIGLLPSFSLAMSYARLPELPLPNAIGVPHTIASNPFRPPIA